MICPGMKKRKPKEKEGLAKMEEDGGENDEEYEKMLKDVEDEVYAFVSVSLPAGVRRSNHIPTDLSESVYITEIASVRSFCIILSIFIACPDFAALIKRASPHLWCHRILTREGYSRTDNFKGVCIISLRL